MRGDNKVTAFAVGCGDTLLIEAHFKTILIDIHYREEGCQDKDNDEVPDIAPDLRDACPDHHLHIFVLTHPDKDHVRGADKLFHMGRPEDWVERPANGSYPKILMDEIWCSPYATNPHYVTDEAKPLLDEIKRRKALQGTVEGMKDGNRLVVMDTSTHTTGAVEAGLEWRLLAPTPAEWNIPKAPEGEPPTSSNPTSLVIQWTITIGSFKNQFLSGGDTTVDVLERLEREVHRKNPDHLAWHMMAAFHHCSRRSIGRVANSGQVDEEFEQSDTALKAIGEQRGDGFVISSSRRIVRGGNTPPSFHAKNRYLKILARGGEVTDNERKRFLCTGGENEGDKPAHVVFNLTIAGPTRAQKQKSPGRGAAIAPAAGLGGGYGRR